jgi:hypothetical protein
MKKVALLICAVALITSSFAQSEEASDKKGGFKKENIFVGGGLGLGIGGWSGGFNVGATPEVGYSVARMLDAGISTNINYYSFRAEVNGGIRQRSTNYGGGVFLRFFPVKSFFIQALPEYNWTNTTLHDQRAGVTTPDYKIKQEAPSLLLGVGYGTRFIGESNFYTILMFDAGNNPNSPYVDSYGSKLPILRAAFNIYLHPKRR